MKNNINRDKVTIAILNLVKVKKYEKALNLFPKHSEANFSIGNAYRDIGEIGKAISHLKKAVLYRDDYFEAHLNLAILLAKKREIFECLPHIKKVVQAKNVNPKLILDAAKIYLDLELFEKGYGKVSFPTSF